MPLCFPAIRPSRTGSVQLACTCFLVVDINSESKLHCPALYLVDANSHVHTQHTADRIFKNKFVTHRIVQMNCPCQVEVSTHVFPRELQKTNF